LGPGDLCPGMEVSAVLDSRTKRALVCIVLKSWGG
jgi:hypothetical protein